MDKQVISAGYARNYRGCRIYIKVTRGLNTWEDKHAYVDIKTRDGDYIHGNDFGFLYYTTREIQKKAREYAHDYIDNLLARCA